jgi:hypothetical protein
MHLNHEDECIDSAIVAIKIPCVGLWMILSLPNYKHSKHQTKTVPNIVVGFVQRVALHHMSARPKCTDNNVMTLQYAIIN